MGRHGSDEERKGGKGNNEDGRSQGDGFNMAENQSPSPAPARSGKIWAFVSAFLLIISIAMLFYALRARSEISNYDSNLVNCTMELDNLEKEIDETKREVTRLRSELHAVGLGRVSRASLLQEHIELYRKRGLRNPAQSIIADIMKHPELIPYEPAEGRPFRFSSRNEVHILSPNRVLAVFTNGTADGWMLLKYDVKEDGKITWKLLESYCSRCEK
jgi:hypothetical protein